MNSKRFYVFTGKGGVGKTLTALSFSQYLKNQNKKILFVDFEQGEGEKLCEDLQIPHLRLDFMKSTQEYIGRKLKSEIVASWVCSTQFFKAMINIIPGFSYLIFLGHLLDMLKKDPELTIILDSPSTGHAITMLEAAKNYGSIFRAGVLFNDIVSMLKFIKDEDVLKINICTIPTQMALNESFELSHHIKTLTFENVSIFLNFSLTKLPLEKEKELPFFLQEKLSMEEELEKEFNSRFVTKLPYSIQSKGIDRVHELSALCQDLV